MPDVIDHAPDPDPGGNPEPEGEALSRLLHFAGPRPSAPAKVVAEVKRATYPSWRSKVRAVARSRRRRRVWMLAAAAMLLVSAGLMIWRLPSGLSLAPGLAVRVATVEVASGAVAIDGTRAGASETMVGMVVAAGGEIETGPGGLATLRLAGGSSVRLDAGTALRLESANALELRRGAVYLDTGPAAALPRRGASGTPALRVTTPYGVARDVGTQFEVRLLEDALKIQVREGEVEVDLGGASHAATAGIALRVGVDGRVAREEISAHGPAWRWILASSPPFELEGRTLGEFLEWVARETGWRPRFADANLEREVMGTVVHGSITGVRPDQAPDLVLPSSGLQYRLEDGTMVIEQAGASTRN